MHNFGNADNKTQCRPLSTFSLHIHKHKQLNNMKNKPDKEILDSMAKNPANWKGILYFNRKDPRLIVQKLYPTLGWTLNFANPLTYLAVIFIVLAVVVVTVLTN